MAEQQDWIDRAIAPGTWEPPAGFTDRLVVQAMAALPPRKISPFSLEGLRATVVGFGESVRARLEGSAWVVLQYREMIFR